jgi:hypothetical protein
MALPPRPNPDTIQEYVERTGASLHSAASRLHTMWLDEAFSDLHKRVKVELQDDTVRGVPSPKDIELRSVVADLLELLVEEARR